MLIDHLMMGVIVMHDDYDGNHGAAGLRICDPDIHSQAAYRPGDYGVTLQSLDLDLHLLGAYRLGACSVRSQMLGLRVYFHLEPTV